MLYTNVACTQITLVLHYILIIVKKLRKKRFNTDLRKHFFTDRIINIWNALDDRKGLHLLPWTASKTDWKDQGIANRWVCYGHLWPTTLNEAEIPTQKMPWYSNGIP